MAGSTFYKWLSLLFVLAVQRTTAADCPCGYLDPTTDSLWTDAIVTYFNETDAASDIVTTPTISPSYQGDQSAGNTGNGTQDWSIIGDQLNAYEDGFDATYRSGLQYNNTAIRNTLLEMYLQPADRKNRIVYGAECKCEKEIESILCSILTVTTKSLLQQLSLEDGTFSTAHFELP